MVSGHNITANQGGVWFYGSDNNIFYHNNFISNTEQVDSTYCMNVWDDGIEGNYWSDYNGIDYDYDGIGDILYFIESIDVDCYPLVGMFSSFNTSLGLYVNVISNSTIEDFEYFESNSTIRMYVSNMTATQTYGFCRICIPHTLMDVSSISVIIDGGLTPVLYQNYTLYDNGTHRWIYFAYPHSIHEIDITPEFPSLIISSLFMIATLLAVVVYKRKHFV